MDVDHFLLEREKKVRDEVSVSNGLSPVCLIAISSLRRGTETMTA
jgi:hypothetical protein